MAKEDEKKNKAPIGGTNGGTEVKLDAEFQELSTDAEGWWKPVEGMTLQGVLLGFVPRWDWDDENEDTHKFDFLVKLTRPAMIVKGKDALPEEAAPSTIVFMPGSYKLEQVYMQLCDYGPEKFEVQVKPIGQIKTSSGRKMWRFKTGAKALTAECPVPKLMPKGMKERQIAAGIGGTSFDPAKLAQSATLAESGSFAASLGVAASLGNRGRRDFPSSPVFLCKSESVMGTIKIRLESVRGTIKIRLESASWA